MPHKDPAARKAYQAAYHRANREKKLAQSRDWASEHRDEVRDYHRRYYATRKATDPTAVSREHRRAWLAHRYRLSPDAYAEMADRQHNRCAICGAEPAAGKALHIDHDHATGRVRALLCGPCNRGIGSFRDDPSIAEKAARYLRRFEGEK